MIRRILVPLDGSRMSERALDAAVELAGGLDATICVLRVVEPVTGRTDLPNAPDPFMEAQRKEADGYVGQICDRLGALGIGVDCHVFAGDAASHIFRFTEFEHCDIVVMSSHGLGGGAWHVFGSVAQKILHTARIPVMIVGPGTEHTASDSVPHAEVVEAGA